MKKRLDQLLVDRGLTDNKSRAQALVLAGSVFSGERRLDKPGTPLAEDIALEVRGAPHPYVSRGGLKLVQALDHFAFDPGGLVALDVGASTGGFTDVLLQRGAAKVYAVDVGHGQLAWKLRSDPRVVVIERFNIRNVTAQQISEPPGAIVCDVSFIGLQTALPAALALAAPGAFLAALIKPQFEAGRGQVGKGGIVRDPALHQEVCQRIGAWLADRPGWQVLGITPSPISGADGNLEFLIGARFEGGQG
ncbi:MAG: TlyA family RNA methyltransferase [Rhodospirillales bacterium]